MKKLIGLILISLFLFSSSVFAEKFHVTGHETHAKSFVDGKVEYLSSDKGKDVVVGTINN